MEWIPPLLLRMGDNEADGVAIRSGGRGRWSGFRLYYYEWGTTMQMEWQLGVAAEVDGVDSAFIITNGGRRCRWSGFRLYYYEWGATMQMEWQLGVAAEVDGVDSTFIITNGGRPRQ